MMLDVPKILSSYFGGNFVYQSLKVPCLFHEEEHASLCIDTNTGVFHCFGCGAKGDIIDLVAKIEGVNRLKALVIAQKIGGNSTHAIPIEKQNRNWLHEAKVEFNSCIKPSWSQIKSHYILNRGFLPKTLKEFDVRLDPFSNYPLIIPLYENNKFRGYVRRRIDGNDDDRKYLYNKGFRRNNVLIGSYRKGVILVTEGILDLMKAWQGGFRNVCCFLGWKPTKYQLEKLKRYTNVIISALDNTETGEEGTALLSEHFKVIRFPFPEHRKDLGEMSTYEMKYAYTLIKEEKLDGKRKR